MKIRKTVICLSALLLILVACSTVEKAVDVQYVSQSNVSGHVRVDSVVLRDSVFVREQSDTVFYTKYRTIYKERLRVDTFLRCDTVFLDREVVVEKVREPAKKSGLVWKVPIVALLLFLLWRTGMLKAMWNLILKGVGLCKRVFHLKE